MPKSKLLLINDTSGTPNPGCRAASDALLKALGVRGDVVWRIPVGYRADEFASIPGVRPRCIVKQKGHFNIYDQIVTEVDFEKWLSLSSEVYGKDSNVMHALELCDEIIINAEGTVHHNFKRAIALLGLIHEVTKSRKPTIVVNSSVMAMDERIVEKALQGVSLFHARESLSAAYVSRLCPRLLIHHCPDLAFNINNNSEGGLYMSSPRRRGVLVTPGVFGTPQQLDEILELIGPHFAQKTFLSIGDGGESLSLFEICHKHGASVVSSGEYSWQKLVELLSTYDLVISGRHHINIFCMLTGVPLIPIPSNTWKIEGTLQDVGSEWLPLTTYGDLSRKLEEVIEDGSDKFITPRANIEAAAENVKEFLKKLGHDNYYAV